MGWTSLGIIVALIAVSIVTLLIVVSRFYRKVQVGKLMVIYGFKKNRVSLKNTIVVPFLDEVIFVNSEIHKIEISNEYNKENNRTVRGEFYTLDNLKVTVNVVFFVSLPTSEDVLFPLLSKFDVKSVNSREFLDKHFNSRFAEAVKNGVRAFTLEDLMAKRKEFGDNVIGTLNGNLNGFILNDVSLQEINALPIEAYDDNNHIDVLGKAKIVQISTEQKILMGQQAQKEETELLATKNENEESRIELNRQVAVAKSFADSEISVAATRERLVSEMEEIKADKERDIAEIEKGKEVSLQAELVHREIEAQKITHQEFLDVRREESRKKVEMEREDTQLEIMKRKKLVEKTEVNEDSEIQKQKVILTQTRKDIQVEEEAIENMKVEQRMSRYKTESVDRATADAESFKITKSNDSAVAVEISKNEIEVKRNVAEGDFIAEERKAEAMIVMAGATLKQESASGLAEAEVIRSKGMAAAETEKASGLANAEVLLKKGMAMAETEKASYDAKSNLSPDVRKHELDVIGLANDLELSLEQARVGKDIAVANASVMAAAMDKADIKVFGEGDVFQKIKTAMLSGQEVDARFDNSDVMNSLIGGYRDGSRNFAEDMTAILSSQNSTGGAIKDVALAANLNKFVDMLGGKEKILDLLNKQ